MDIHEKYGLTKIINGAGTFTPLGVSRSSPEIGQSVANALGEFFVIDELQEAASAVISRWSGAEAGAVIHCVSSAITLSIAAAMAGCDADKIAALPDTTGMANRVVLPAGHAVNYGHSILQDIRLAGAEPVLAGSPDRCTISDLEKHLAEPRTACLLLVSSRLVTGEPVDLAAGVTAAHKAGVPAIIDCAAQDMRLPELLETGADLLLFSAHKYMASPTAGLIIGSKQLVHAAHAHEKGIGRSMKASKEAIIGVMVAIEQRQNTDPDTWRLEQKEKLDWFIEHANQIEGIKAKAVPDICGMPFSRACLTIDPSSTVLDVASIAEQLKNGSPSVRVMESFLERGEIMLELVPLSNDELQIIIQKISQILAT